MGMIDIRTYASIKLVLEKVNAILADKNLKKFMTQHHPKVHLALRDFQEFSTYPYMCSLRYVIGDNAPIKDGKYKPASVDDLARSIDMVTCSEVKYRQGLSRMDGATFGCLPEPVAGETYAPGYPPKGLPEVDINPGELYTQLPLLLTHQPIVVTADAEDAE